MVERLDWNNYDLFHIVYSKSFTLGIKIDIITTILNRYHYYLEWRWNTVNKKMLILSLVLVVVLSIFLVGCGKEEQPAKTEDGKGLTIYTSIYPLYDFTKKIVGDKGTVINLVPSNTESHDYEPTAKDVLDLSKADLFVYNGGGFETWIEKIVDAVKGNNTKMVVLQSTANIELLSPDETGLEQADEHVDEHAGEHADEHAGEQAGEHTDEHAEEHTEEHTDEHIGEQADEHGHEHGDFDPHIWLDPILALQQAEAIKTAVVALDPENAEYYENNFSNLTEQFKLLDQKFQDLSAHIERQEFVVSHASYGYLAKRYGLKQVALSGINPSDEPSTQELQEIISFVKENKIKYIMFENLVSTKVAEVVREEVGAEAIVLHNLEGLTKEDISQEKDYFSLMDENLEALKKALGYK
jgi:zinc transport system substrate-binding protein